MKLVYHFRYVLIGHKANGTLRNPNIIVKPMSQSVFRPDTSVKVTLPGVSSESVSVYKKYIETGIRGGFDPSNGDVLKYQKYVDNKINQTWII